MIRCGSDAVRCEQPDSPKALPRFWPCTTDVSVPARGRRNCKNEQITKLPGFKVICFFYGIAAILPLLQENLED
jgi:hypothetical protein